MLKSLWRHKIKNLGRQTGVSPEDLSEHCFDEFRGYLPSFFHFNPNVYAKLNWSKQSGGDLDCFTDDARHVSKNEELLTPNQIYFLDNIRGHGKDALIDSLRAAHDSIAYVSDQEIDKQMKDVFIDLKLLGDWLEKI